MVEAPTRPLDADALDPEMEISQYSHLPRWRHRVFKAMCVLEGVTMEKVIGSCVENELVETPGIAMLESVADGFRGHQRNLTPPKSPPALSKS
jgi:hypothetical protein